VQDTTVPMWLAVISYWFIGMPTGYVMGFVFDWGGIGIWLGLCAGLGAAALSLNLRFWRRAVRIGA
jgi:MATE family multidrug resistance protein